MNHWQSLISKWNNHWFSWKIENEFFWSTDGSGRSGQSDGVHKMLNVEAAKQSLDIEYFFNARLSFQLLFWFEYKTEILFLCYKVHFSNFEWFSKVRWFLEPVWKERPLNTSKINKQCEHFEEWSRISSGILIFYAIPVNYAFWKLVPEQLSWPKSFFISNRW